MRTRSHLLLSSLLLGILLSQNLMAADSLENNIVGIYTQNPYYESVEDAVFNRVLLEYDYKVEVNGVTKFITLNADQISIQLPNKTEAISKLYLDSKSHSLTIMIEGLPQIIATENASRLSFSSEWQLDVRVQANKFQLVLMKANLP